MAISIAVIGGCSSDKATTTSSSSTSDETTVQNAAASPDTPAPTADAGAVESAVMPDVQCGTDLQVAQDRVQETGVFFSRSEDATGRGRNQIMDSNWTVVGQRPTAGTQIGEGDAVFLVVKDDEFTGC